MSQSSDRVTPSRKAADSGGHQETTASGLAVAAPARKPWVRGRDLVGHTEWVKHGRVGGRLRVGILGAGKAGACHATAYSQIPDVAVTALWNRTRSTADQLAGRLASPGLEIWAESPTDQGQWSELAHGLHIAVSVDLENDPVKGQPTFTRGTIDVFSSSREVMYRQPRPAVLRVWKLIPTASGQAFETPIEVECRRLEVNYPGNETEIDISSGADTTRAVAVEFDDNGALTKITTDLIDASLQRARDVSGLVSAASEAATAGANLRKAVAPPTLVERAAEQKAAKELGLVPSELDPLEPVRQQLEEARLRAQLKIAEQIAVSNSVPILVQF